MSSPLETLQKKIDKLFEQEKFKEIIKLLNDDVLEKYKDAELYTDRGIAWYDKGDYDKAITDYTKAIDLKPDYVYAYFNRGFAWQRREGYDNAITDYTIGLSLKPDDAAAYNNRGLAWANKGEYDKAITDYNKAIDLKPDYAAAYYNRGATWYDKGQYDKAITDYTKAIDLNPDYADAYYNRGNAWSNKGQYDKAITDYTKAIDLKPDYAAAYNGRGNAWYNKGQYDKAITDYTKAIDLKPDYSSPFFNIGRLYYSKGQYEKAKAAYQKKVKLTVSKPDYYTQLAKEKLEEIDRLLTNKEFKKISEIVGKIKKLLLFNDGLITHYTQMTTAKALIFNNSPFRLSEGAFLNDTSEGRELLEFLNITFSTQKHKGTALAEVFAQKPFIGSFVTDSKFDDLTLWRMYGKEENVEARGCAITIDMKKLIDNINDKLVPDKSAGATQTNEDINFYRVAYHSKENKDEFIIPGAGGKTEAALNKLMNQLATKAKPYWDKTNEKKDLEELLNSITYLFKSAIYMHENELRLVVKGIGFDKNIPNPPRVYIELVGIKNIIQKITLGPKVDKPDEWAAAFYYSYDKESSKPEIMISHLPFK